MFRVLSFLLTILITNAFAKCWKLSAVLRNTYFLPRLRLFLKKIWSNKFFLPVLNKNYNSFNFNFCKTVRDRFPCVWKPAPRSSMGCKFYGRFFFSSRKILSVVCRLVDHYIGLFISFLKISRPVYETSQNLSFSVKANCWAFFSSTYRVFLTNPAPSLDEIAYYIKRGNEGGP